MPIGPKRMPFLDHIAELRWRLLIIAAAVAVLSLATYPFAFEGPAGRPGILGFLLLPIQDLLPASGKLVLSGPFQGFTFRFKVSMWAAVILAMPVIIWQVFAFFLPALRPRERKWFLPTVASMLALFVAGLAFCYFVIMRPAFTWMLAQGSSAVTTSLPFADQWAGGIMLLLLAFALAFQVPVIIFYLIAFNIVPYKVFRQNWRYAYLLLAVFAAVATPDWSPVTMGSLFGALILLYEASLLLAKVVFSKRQEAEALALAEEE